MLILSALFLWTALLALIGWLIARATEEQFAADLAPPRDPIVDLVDKWAHDWERGRA